jgi:hypothetical protein
MPADYVRIALRPEEFDRLLEIVEGLDEPVVLKLRAKALSVRAKQLRKEGETPSKRAALARLR